MNDAVPIYVKRDDEPAEWYLRFVKFYLDAGMARSLRDAYWRYMYAEKTAELEANPNVLAAPSDWVRAANEYNWAERAAAYDDELIQEAQLRVRQARLRLQALTMSAVDALEQSLSVAKTRVAAAREILDRGGIPAKSQVEMGVKPILHADDFADLAEEVDAWEQQHLNELNGSSAPDPQPTS